MDQTPIEQPHDRLTKGAFGRKEGARALLSTFLPRELRAEFDLDALEIVASNLLGDDLRESVADILFALPMRRARIRTVAGDTSAPESTREEGEEEVVLLHVLFEHKSTSHRFTVADLFVSTGRLWSMWRRAHPRSNDLPRVLPMLLHHGPTEWTAPSTLSELLQGRGHVSAHLLRLEPALPLLIVDLAVTTESQIDAIAREDALAGAALFLLQRSRSVDAEEAILRRIDLLANVIHAPGPVVGFPMVLHYIAAVTCRGKHASRFFAQILKRLPRSTRAMAKTLREQWIEEGIELGVEKGLEKGIEKGIELGVHQGEATGKRNLLRVLVETRFPELIREFEAHLATLREPNELDRLARIIGSANSATEARRHFGA
jgi:hypothetical protein